MYKRQARAAIAKVFTEIGKKKTISLVVRTSRRVREVESYALSKFQPPTTLGDHQNVEKTIREKIDFLGFRKSVFRHFPGFLKESTILGVKINFLVKFCSRYTYSEVRATKNCEKTICAAKTWPLRALSACDREPPRRLFPGGDGDLPANIQW